MIMKARGTVMRREHRHGWQPRRGCTSQHVWNTNDAGCKTTDYETWALGGDQNLRHRAVSPHHPSAHKSVNKYNLCTHAGSGVVLTTQDVLFKDTYIFLLLHVRATQKVSHMLYKQHLGESCNVTTTFKEALCVRMYVRVSYSLSKTFYSKIPIYSCSNMSGLRKKYHICDISSTWERVVM